MNTRLGQHIFRVVFNFCVICSVSCAFADIENQDNDLRNNRWQNSELEEVIVTAAQPTSLARMPRNITVFTREDIQISGAQNIPELLAREANVILNSFSGNAKATRIDIRGSGDTSVSNVLYLQDGFRINTPDLAGTDISTLSLEQVERIELVRGANTVRFGSGALHGVVNILTKKSDKNAVFIKRERGEFDFDKLTLESVIASPNHSFLVNWVNEDNGGYRENNWLNSRDYLISYRGSINERLEWTLKSKSHEDTYALPGPLSLRRVREGSIDRQSSESPLAGSTEDDSQLALLVYNVNDTVNIRAKGFYRERKNYFYFFFPELEYFGSTNLISLKSSVLDIVLNWNPTLLPIEFTAGGEYTEHSYFRTQNGVKSPIRSRRNGDIRTKAGFVYATYLASEWVRASVGYRRDTTYSRTNKSVVEKITDDKINRWHNEAYEFNFSADVGDSTHLYFSAAETFRTPNIDEFGLTAEHESDKAFSLVGELRTQLAEQYEVGIKHDEGLISINFALFKSRTVDEIIFRTIPTTGSQVNFNYPETILRKGFELDVAIHPDVDFEVGISLGVLDVKIDKDTELPLVPKHTVSTYLEWTPVDNLKLYWNTRYVDERFDGNDFSNTGVFHGHSTILEEYTVTDINISYTFEYDGREIAAYLKINNAFNELYTTLSYLGIGYPASERSAAVGLSISF